MLKERQETLMPESAYILSQGGLSAVDVSDGDKRAEVVMIGDVCSGLLDQLSVIRPR